MSDTTLLSDTVGEIVLSDRRRQGRVAVDDSLVMLLRNPAGDGECLSELHEAHYGDRDLSCDLDGDPGRGVAFGLLLAIPLWAILIEGGRLAFGS